MGCDGGTIPKRHELVKTKKKDEQRDKNADLAAKWKHCALSNQPLQEPIVACELGRLYNKDAVIEYLLDKSGDKFEKMSHVKGLKDIHTLKLHSNPSWKSKMEKAEKGDGYIDDQDAKFICPVAGIEMNGRYKFCYLRTCGCVLSNRALKEVQTQLCPTCSVKYTKENDVIILNGSKEEEAVLRQKMETTKQAAKSKKRKNREKNLKCSKNSIEEISEPKTNGHSSDNASDKPSTSGITNSIKIPTASHIKSLTVNETVKGAKRKINEGSIFKSESFKSIFTSHSSAKRSKDSQGHWVTYNPYHYVG